MTNRTIIISIMFTLIRLLVEIVCLMECTPLVQGEVASSKALQNQCYLGGYYSILFWDQIHNLGPYLCKWWWKLHTQSLLYHPWFSRILPYTNAHPVWAFQHLLLSKSFLSSSPVFFVSTSSCCPKSGCLKWNMYIEALLARVWENLSISPSMKVCRRIFWFSCNWSYPSWLNFTVKVIEGCLGFFFLLIAQP